MALKSWKVEGSFVKGLFPKALAVPAGDRQGKKLLEEEEPCGWGRLPGGGTSEQGQWGWHPQAC